MLPQCIDRNVQTALVDADVGADWRGLCQCHQRILQACKRAGLTRRRFVPLAQSGTTRHRAAQGGGV